MIHNIIDFLGTTCIIVAGILSLIASPLPSLDANDINMIDDFQIVFSSIGVFQNWMMCLQLGLSFSQYVGIQISMVEKMISDVLRITCIMFLFIIAFNCSQLRLTCLLFAFNC